MKSSGNEQFFKVEKHSLHKYWRNLLYCLHYIFNYILCVCRRKALYVKVQSHNVLYNKPFCRRTPPLLSLSLSKWPFLLLFNIGYLTPINYPMFSVSRQTLHEFPEITPVNRVLHLLQFFFLKFSKFWEHIFIRLFLSSYDLARNPSLLVYEFCQERIQLFNINERKEKNAKD